MAKVATQGLVSSNAVQYVAGPLKVGTGLKRKTPSELRGEQLKRKHVVELVDESPASELSSLKSTTGSKYPRYINTRLDEVYPIKKSSIRLRMLSGKESAKPEESPVEHTGTLKSCSVSSVSAAKSQPQVSCPEDFASSGVTRDGEAQASKTNEKCRESTFRSVTDLSSGGEKTTGLDTIDLDRALKGLVAHEPSLLSSLAPDSSERIGDFTIGNLCSEFNILGRMTPLDFTLKTTMRVVSSSSVNWFHRLITRGSCSGVAQFCQKMSCSSGFTSTNQVGDNLRVLHSWVYPQSSLPPSLVAALTISSTEQVQMDFLSKRQTAWEDAFRSLYYMLRKGACDIFYVCTAQFVVMFIGHGDSKESKRSCNAYISQSTRSLRSLLKEHDIQFLMPLCHSKVEQHTTEDLVELSEIEKHNLGQIQRHRSMSDVDNSPQSLLGFSGNQNVHGLFDFLLNYRFFLTSLTSADVPVLYSPVPFQNAALSSPEVRCKEVRKADNFPFPQKEFTSKDETYQGSSAGFCYSIEIKDAYLPPWIICSLCEAMGSEGMSFEASFATESTSTGLNVGLETIREKSNHQPTGSAGLEESSSVLGISNATISPKLCSAFLKGLKYSNGSYTATVSSV
ncbi:hypothetical protein RHMOL_Rhmol03G0064200 [Rhododendron molle]|uniref:Uncharacterized protein n=2 Tax=Rhododendron molle TaxID=49168 RepID=A0ACC0PDL1_RHOML|nr:hypothetical protein RHMOL_Rhmol03G0064200 [Rhododendron molle]KAI8562813.1 hypothetical protein RHMOL_Rhmol03G0064200 [Rhododendron molle]